MANKTAQTFNFKKIFDSDDELRQYHPSELSLFALSLYLKIENIHEFAANSITEGRNDKKIDLCYLDETDKRLIIVQSYVSDIWGKSAAPQNKASDLNTATAWLFSASEDSIPINLQAKAKEVREALKQGNIERVEIFYIHNCLKSKNVEIELKTVADAARDKIAALLGGKSKPIIKYLEVGLETIEELYKARDSEILIDEWIDIPATDYLQENGKGWKAILTTVPASWIAGLYKQHNDRLFSANYRDYMGYTRSKENINYAITMTAENEPKNFWVYNNGITALTHELRPKESKIRGISIINGAQTTGALSDALEMLIPDAHVLIRIVQCNSKELIDRIILYNNTQNEIKPSDRKSNDSIQKRLHDDFAKHRITYSHRRSSLRNPKNAIIAATIAPALCAFHGDIQTAYRNARSIFTDDATYQKVFPSNIQIEHIFLVSALSSAFDRVKNDLKKKISEDSATDLQTKEYDVLKYSASKHFAFYVIGAIAEQVMNKKLSDLHEWKCKKEIISPENVSLIESWVSVLHTILPHIATLIEAKGKDAFYETPRSSDRSQEVAKSLVALIASLEPQLGNQFSDIRKRSTV